MHDIRAITVQQPTRYELIDKDGNVVRVFDSAHHAAQFAVQFFPDQSQDEDRTGKGWDIQVCGS